MGGPVGGGTEQPLLQAVSGEDRERRRERVRHAFGDESSSVQRRDEPRPCVPTMVACGDVVG